MSGCPHCTAHQGYSKSQIDWLQQIEKEQNIKIQHALCPEGEYRISGVGKVDGYCHETNTVYEFHGDYWHGNPVLFGSDDINQRVGKTFGELYQKTGEKDSKILAQGYTLVVKWETPIE